DCGALLARKARQRLVEEQQSGPLRERHRDFHSPLLAVGDFPDRSRRALLEADHAEYAASLVAHVGLGGQRPERIPARLRQSEERKYDVVLERILGKEGDDLVGPRQTPMRTLVNLKTRDVFAEQSDRSSVGFQIAGDKVEQRRLPGAVGTDDQTA